MPPGMGNIPERSQGIIEGEKGPIRYAEKKRVRNQQGNSGEADCGRDYPGLQLRR